MKNWNAVGFILAVIATTIIGFFIPILGNAMCATICVALLLMYGDRRYVVFYTLLAIGYGSFAATFNAPVILQQRAQEIGLLTALMGCLIGAICGTFLGHRASKNVS
jgi:hypothetical protein